MSTSSSVCTLLEAPDDCIGEEKFHNGISQIMHVELSAETVAEMQRSSDAGKQVQLSFGKNPVLRYGNTSRPFRVSPSAFRNEIYKFEGKNKTLANFLGLVTHTLDFDKVEEAVAGADEALTKLKASMASYESEKKNNQTTLVDNKVKPSVRNATNKEPSMLLKQRARLNGFVTQSVPSSPANTPAMPASSQKQSALVSTSGNARMGGKESTMSDMTPDKQDLLKLKRTALIHLLAMGPTTEETVLRRTSLAVDECRTLLDKVGKRVDGMWALADKYFKDLDVYEFGYKSDEQRENAIENAIRAYDRQRLQPDDDLWQKLLPHRKRGRGICLSKLNLGQSFAGSDHRSLLAGAGEGALSLPRSRSQEPPARKKPSQKEQQTRRLLSAKPGKTTAAAKSTPKTDDESHKPPKESKANEKRKQQAPNSKIKSAEFVHDSDEEALSDLGSSKGQEDRQKEPARAKNDSVETKKMSNLKSDNKTRPLKPPTEGASKHLPKNRSSGAAEETRPATTKFKPLDRVRPDGSRSAKASIPADEPNKPTSKVSQPSPKPNGYSNGYSSLTAAKKSDPHRHTSSLSSVNSPNTPRPSKRSSLDYPTASSSNDETTPAAKRRRMMSDQTISTTAAGTATPPFSQPSSSSSPSHSKNTESKSVSTRPVNDRVRRSTDRVASQNSPSSLDLLRDENVSAWTKYYKIQFEVASAAPSGVTDQQRNALTAAFASAEALSRVIKARKFEADVASGAVTSAFEAERADLVTRKRPAYWKDPQDWQRWLPAPGARMPAGVAKVLEPELAKLQEQFDGFMEKARTVERPAGADDDSLFGLGYESGRTDKDSERGSANAKDAAAAAHSDDTRALRKWEDLTLAERREDAERREKLWELDENIIQMKALLAEAEYQYQGQS